MIERNVAQAQKWLQKVLDTTSATEADDAYLRVKAGLQLRCLSSGQYSSPCATCCEDAFLTCLEAYHAREDAFLYWLRFFDRFCVERSSFL